MSLRCLLFGLCAALLVFAAEPVVAQERRIALVIGNGAYSDIQPLRNPVADARLMRETLTELGFEVIYRENADRVSMERAISVFSARLFEAGPEGVSLFYFAGHGVSSGGENFLLPADVYVSREADLRIAAVRAGDVLAQMDGARSAIKIVILDACRDNPFADTFGATSSRRGLATIGLGNTEFYVAYAATAGNVAEDGGGANSPYALALARRLMTPDSDLDATFRLVRIDVSNATGNRQLPEATSTMRRQFFFRPTSGPSIVATALPPAPVEPPPQLTPTPADFSILGCWRETTRGRGVTMHIFENTLRYDIGGTRGSYPVRSIVKRGDIVELHWMNRGQEIVFEFGDVNPQGDAMTQLRGREGADATWRDYGIRLRRC